MRTNPARAVTAAAGDQAEARNAAPGVERRDGRRQRRVPGGGRESDPPLTTRDVADWMGLTTEWVRGAIDEGVPVAGGRVVKLEAETLTVNNRRTHRIYLDAFRAFLKAIGWRRLPKGPRDASASL